MQTRFVDTLEARLAAADFASLERNPVLRAVESTTIAPNALGSVLLQYAFLPGVIAELLARGVVKLFRWQDVRDELLRNLGEELGSRSDGRAHFAILCDGLENEAGLSPRSATASSATITFIEALRTRISDSSCLGAAGALYALEDSAVPELRVVARLINLYGRSVSERTIIDEAALGRPAGISGSDWTLNRFLSTHIGDFEVGHRDFLAESLAPHITTDADVLSLTTGFDETLTLMEQWWRELASP